MVTFYRKNEAGKFEKIKQFVNEGLENKRSISGKTASELEFFRPLPLERFSGITFSQIMNRSLRMSAENRTIEVPLASFIVDGSKITKELQDVIVSLDLIQDFIRRGLQGHGLSHLFLIKGYWGLALPIHTLGPIYF